MTSDLDIVLVEDTLGATHPIRRRDLWRSGLDLNGAPDGPSSGGGWTYTIESSVVFPSSLVQQAGATIELTGWRYHYIQDGQVSSILRHGTIAAWVSVAAIDNAGTGIISLNIPQLFNGTYDGDQTSTLAGYFPWASDIIVSAQMDGSRVVLTRNLSGNLHYFGDALTNPSYPDGALQVGDSFEIHFTGLLSND
jgi:hypothetical protein